jgi:hypothetical protein
MGSIGLLMGLRSGLLMGEWTSDLTLFLTLIRFFQHVRGLVCILLILLRTHLTVPGGFYSFTVGCKTEEGFTVILVERGEGVETKLVKTSYSPTAGSAYVTFDNVKVPVENTLGQEGGGIFVILRYVGCLLRLRVRKD